MAENLYSKFADLAALEAEKQKVLALFDEIKKGIKSLSESGIKLNTGGDKPKKDIDELLKQTEKLKTLQGDYAKQLAFVKIQQQEVNKVNKEAAKEALGLNDAYKKLEKEYNELARAAKNAAIEQGEDSEQFKKLAAEANTLGEKLKKTDASVGQFQRNVGNYANSLAGGFESVRSEIVKLQKEQTNLQNLSKANPIGFKIGGGEDRLNQINGALQQLNVTSQIGFQTSGNLTQQVKQLEKAYQNMAVSGSQSNEFLEDFKKFVAQSKDQLEDLRGEIKSLSSDTFVFDQIASSVKFVAAGFQTGAALAELFGGKNEDVQKSIQKLLIIQNVANGVQELANQLTLRGSIINKGYVFIQGLLTTAFNTSATAAARFNAALGLLGIAATVIGVIAIAFTSLKKETDDTAKKVDNLNDVLNESKDAYVDAVKNVNSLKQNVQLAKEGFIDKNKVVEQYNETIGKTAGQVKTLDEVEQSLAKNADAYIQFTLLKAAANIALGKAAEKAFESQQIKSIDLTKILSPEKGKEAANKFTSNIIQGAAEGAKSQGDEFTKIANDLSVKAAEIAKKLNFNFFGDTKGNEKEKGKSPLEKEIDLLKEIAETEGFSASKRLGALDLFRTKKAEFIKLSIKDSEEEILRLQQLTNEFGDIFDKIFKWENKEGIIQDIQEVSDVTTEELMKMSEDSDEAIAALGEKVLQGVKNTSELLKAEAELSGLELTDIYTNTFQSIVDGAGSILSGLFDGQKNQIQEQIDEIDRLKAAEIDRVNESGYGEEKKAARIKIIEAKAQSDREALQKRQRQISTQQAIADRALRAFQIIIDGQQASARILAEIAILKAKIAAAGPAGPVLFGPGLALALSSLTQQRISTIVSLASVLATPIPKFGKGKNASNSYSGPGIVGEAGRELGINEKGQVTMFDKPTLTYLSKGTTILPNKVTEDIMRAAESERIDKIKAFTNNVTVSFPDNRDILEKTYKEVRELNRKPPMIIHNERGIESSAWYQQHMKY